MSRCPGGAVAAGCCLAAALRPPGIAWLDGDGSQRGRYAVLAVGPSNRCGDGPQPRCQRPFCALQQLSPGPGHWLGWLSYEAAAWIEPGNHWHRRHGPALGRPLVVIELDLQERQPACGDGRNLRTGASSSIATSWRLRCSDPTTRWQWPPAAPTTAAKRSRCAIGSVQVICSRPTSRPALNKTQGPIDPLGPCRVTPAVPSPVWRADAGRRDEGVLSTTRFPAGERQWPGGNRPIKGTRLAIDLRRCGCSR